jgi:hypothetical protein
MNPVTLAGLLKISLKSGGEIRLTDGGFVTFEGQTYAADDPVYGSLASCESLATGVNEEVPALRFTLLPKDSASIATIAAQVNQSSAVRMVIAEIDPETGAITGTPSEEFLGVIERLAVKTGPGVRTLEVEVAASAVRLLSKNEGNRCSSAFHKTVWPGETGEDNRTGLSTRVAWGAASPPQSTVTVASTGGGGILSGINVNYA